MKVKTLVVLLIFMVSMVACSRMTTREQRTLSGGAIGAGTGAALSIITGGSVGTGSAFGAAAGALGGLIYDESRRR